MHTACIIQLTNYFGCKIINTYNMINTGDILWFIFHSKCFFKSAVVKECPHVELQG